MKRTRFTLCLAGFLMLAFLAIPVLAINGRDFAGTYSTSNVSQSGDNYMLTFSAKVFNYSGEDVSNATISLKDSVLPGQTYAVFQGVSISSNHSATVSSSVTIPAREYQGWKQGSPPHLVVQFVDLSGNNRMENVELTQGVAQ
jgi:hypothetical protein